MRPGKGIDAARGRWRQKVECLGLPDPDGVKPTERRGLGRRFPELSTRIILLPSDPFRTDLQFDSQFWQWWGEERPAPFGGPVRWDRSLPTGDAAVRVQGHGDSWKACLALHRYGGVEVISQDFYTLRDGLRVLRLVRSVALLWIALDAQVWVLNHLEVPGPWQIVVALHDTEKSALGNVAKGWAEPYHLLAHDLPRCPEPNVLIAREFEEFPTEPEAVRDLAYELGGRIEDAWGMQQRRFLSRTGEAVGEFDAREWSL